jgi:pimeloyl-ACP methyl ester carboxylesterase
MAEMHSKVTPVKRASFVPVLRTVFFFILSLMLSWTSVSSAADRKVGIVLLHGKWGSPDKNIDRLASSLRGSGFDVITPVMPWSRQRGYDADYPAAIVSIDDSVRELRKDGATVVVVAGHSMGANAAIAAAAYGHEAVDAVIAIAPGHTPDQPIYRNKVAASLEDAKAMISAGKGAEKGSFLDLNAGRESTAPMAAAVYASYNDPNGMASMPITASKVKAGIPLLWIIAGPEDVLYKQGQGYVFDSWPLHPKNKYAIMNTTHLNAPNEAIGEVIEWINAL